MAKEDDEFWGGATHLEKTFIVFEWVVIIIASVIIFLVKNEIVL